MSKYKIVRSLFLRIKPMCEVCGMVCSTEVHHKLGRLGDLLCDSTYFLAVCTLCHDRITYNPAWARDKKYSLDRLAK